MKWISVEDKLPEEGQAVLITQHEYMDEDKPRYYMVSRYIDGFWFEAFDVNDSTCPPTHWQFIETLEE